jgi:hypothetical protein
MAGHHVHLAVESADEDIIEFLLGKGANINAKEDKSGFTALHHAVRLGKQNAVELLIAKGADINAKDDESGFTALHHAVRLGNRDTVETLIARDADINAKDKQGHTPLYIAANHDYKAAEFLMSKGADSSIRIESGLTLLELAQQRKQIESTVPDMIFEGASNSFFGLKIACGDVDGDGNDDVLITAANYDNRRGRVYLFYGGQDMDTNPDLIFEGQNEGDYFGSGLSCGDIDNDGHEDIFIGAGWYNNKQGRAYLFHGSSKSSMNGDPDTILESQIKDGCYGIRVVCGDIDGDNVDDLVIGATRYRHDVGRVYVYWGNELADPNPKPGRIFTGENPNTGFGYGFACGDVNNDGCDDLVIGAPKGRAYLYYGGPRSK